MIKTALILLATVQVTLGTYMTVNVGTSAPYNTHGCLEFNGDSMRKGTVTPNRVFSSSYVGYMLDFDGVYNMKTTGTHTDFNGWNPNYSSNTKFKGTSSGSNAITWNMGVVSPTLGDCQARCDGKPACIGVIYGPNLASDYTGNACQLMLQCKKRATPVTGVDSYMKTSWTGFIPKAVKPMATCGGGTASSTMPISANPPTPKECFTHCSGVAGTTHFEITADLECKCYSSCTVTNSAASDTGNFDEPTWRTTVYELETSPTPAPTAPTTPTTAPPTPAPTQTPAPTPTPAPTNAPASSSDSGLSGGAAAGITIGVLAFLGGTIWFLNMRGVIQLWPNADAASGGQPDF